MKKCLSLILVFILLFSSFSLNTSADGIDYYNYNGFVYITGDYKDKVIIVNYKGKETNVTIPTEINGRKVLSIVKYGNIEQLHIPDGIEVMYIAKAKKLKKITVNKTNKKYSVKNNLLLNKNKTILYGCPGGNKKPKIPSSVKTIANHAFENAKFKKISLPKGLKTIENNAFENCKKLKSIKFPNKLKKIGSQAFLGCISLKSVKIPDSVKEVNSFAFSECKKLKNVTLGKEIKYLDDAFTYCKSLKEIEIPKTVNQLGAYAFSDSDSLESIYIYNKKCKIYYEKFVADNGYAIYTRAIPEHVTIYGYKGSTAQRYAKRNGNKFVILK